jgi:hypothetical protein
LAKRAEESNSYEINLVTWMAGWGGSNWSVPMGAPHVLLAEMGCHDCFCLFQEMSPQPPNKVGMDLPRVAAPPRLTSAHVNTITASKDVVPWAPLVEPAPYVDDRLPYPTPLQPVWRRRADVAPQLIVRLPPPLMW